MSDTLHAPRPAGVWVLGLAGLRGQIARLPLSFGRPYLACSIYLIAMATVGLAVAGPGSRRLDDVLMFLPPQAHAALRGTALFLWVFVPAALALPTLSPARGRSNYLTQLPLGPRRTGLALCFPLILALVGLGAVLTPTLLASAATTSGPQLAAQFLIIVGSAVSSALLVSHSARALVRRGVLPSLGHSGVAGVGAIFVCAVVVLGLRAVLSGNAPTLLALGEQPGTDMATAAAMSLLLSGLAVDLCLHSVALPRTGIAFGSASWSFLLSGRARPEVFHLVRAWRSPRVREFRHIVTLMLLALLVLGRQTPQGARGVHAENLLFVIGATGLVLAGLSMAVVFRRAGLDVRVLVVVSALSVVWTALLGGLCLVVLAQPTETPKLALLIVTTAALAPLACLMGAMLLPSGNLRTQYDAVSLAAASAGQILMVWALDRAGVPDSLMTPIAATVSMGALVYLTWKLGLGIPSPVPNQKFTSKRGSSNEGERLAA